MANFEAFRWNFSSSTNLKIGKSATSKLYLQHLFLPGCNLKASTATPGDIFVETEAARSDMKTSEVLKCGLRFWRTWVVIVVPLIALPILFQGQEKEVKFRFLNRQKILADSSYCIYTD